MHLLAPHRRFLSSRTWCLLAAATLCPALCAARKPSVDLSAVRVERLRNGLTVIVREGHGANLVSVQAWVKAGSRNETSANNGVAHLLEHLLFRGSRNWGDGEAERSIEALGGVVNAETSRDSTRYYVTVASGCLEQTLTTLADILLKPTFPERAFASEKTAARLEIAGRPSNPEVEVSDLIFANAYRVHSYRLPVTGTADSLARLTLDQVTAFYRTFYLPCNMAIVVVGDVSSEATLKLVEKAFGGAKEAKAPDLAVAAEPPQADVRRLEKIGPLREAVAALGFHAPGIQSPRDVCAVDLLITMLGNTPASTLKTALVEKKRLVTDFGVDFLTQRDPGMITFTFTLPFLKWTAVQEEVSRELGRLKDRGPTDNELKRTKTYLRTDYAFSNETYDGQGAALGFYECISSYRFAGEYEDIVESITIEEIRRAAQRYLDLQRRTVVLFRPRGETERTTVALNASRAAWLFFRAPQVCRG